ncbi:putative transcription elongation factor S-II [Rosellinia necatrix]|uniref:Transcription elongation factor n=1 Tax=Rosellinia necatrix TaxID=77044 RepID=A0A1W2TKF6_ROSNE|nr:putative transcription elongation factor S-II [Rosellinia necatrix]
MSTEQRELESRIKALHKAQSEKAPTATIITLLEGLKKDVRPTEEMLRTTKAGLVVGKLRGHVNKEIGRAANEVVAKWRKSVEEEKKAKSLHAPGGRPRDSASPASKAASPAPKPVAVGSSTKVYEGNPDTRKFQTDNIDIKRTDSVIRNNCIGVLYNGLAYRSTEPEDTVLTKAMAVEAAAFKAYKGETQAYKEKVRSLFQNLKVKANADLGRNVMAGVITPDKFVVMTSKQLQSAEQRKMEAELEAQNMKKAQVPMVEKSISDSLECSACKKRMVSYSQAQTRSADEPMTTFCECMNCGKRWKFS